MASEKNKRFKGIYPALITPLDENGNLIEQAVKPLMDWQIERGVEGFYICGATGEGPMISEKNRMAMAEAAVDVARGRAKIINHIGAIDYHEAVRLARHARDCGCDAISSLAPTYLFDYGEDQLVDYYRSIAEAGGIPLLVYATGLLRMADITGFIGRLMSIGHVIGLKFTRMNYYEMQQITLLNGGDINVINGPDEMLICGLTMGADAGIGSTYNVMPGRFVKLYERFLAGDIETARRTQYEINRVIRVLIKHGVIASIKEIFNMSGLNVGIAAYPGRRFCEESRAALRRDLNEAGFYEDFNWG